MNKKKAIPIYVFLALMVVICAAYFVTESSLFRQPADENTQLAESEEAVSYLDEENLPDMYRYVSTEEHFPKPDVFVDG